MRVKDSQPTLKAYIPATQIDGFGAFHDQRSNIYKDTKGNDRTDALSELLESASMKDGVPLVDVVLDQITAEHAAETARDRLEAAQTLASRVLCITMSDELIPLDVTERIVVPIDEDAVDKQQKMAAKIGYGPKQNDSSFRISGR